MIASIAMTALILAQPKGPSDASVTDLKDGYVRVDTSSYVIDVPRDWKVTEETPWGARKASPSGSRGDLGVMTAPPSRQSWAQLYRTSLYFILREDPNGKPTEPEITKRKDGLEVCTFRILNSEGFAFRRFVMLRHSEQGLLALSVRIPNKSEESKWQKHFDRMVASAKFKV